MFCYQNDIASLDLTQNTSLIRLWCHINQLVSLDLSQNTDLEWLQSGANKLSVLDVSQNTALTKFESLANQLSYLNIKNGNNSNFTEFKATNNPNLTCIEVDDKAYSAANWTNIDPASTFVDSQAECNALAIEDFEIAGFMMYPNPVQNQLTITGKNMNIDEIRVFDHTGRMIRNINWKGNSTNLNNLAPGIYILRIKTDQGTTARKMLKI